MTTEEFLTTKGYSVEPIQYSNWVGYRVSNKSLKWEFRPLKSADEAWESALLHLATGRTINRSDL